MGAKKTQSSAEDIPSIISLILQYHPNGTFTAKELRQHLKSQIGKHKVYNLVSRCLKKRAIRKRDTFINQKRTVLYAIRRAKTDEKNSDFVYEKETPSARDDCREKSRENHHQTSKNCELIDKKLGSSPPLHPLSSLKRREEIKKEIKKKTREDALSPDSAANAAVLTSFFYKKFGKFGNYHTWPEISQQMLSQSGKTVQEIQALVEWIFQRAENRWFADYCGHPKPLLHNLERAFDAKRQQDKREADVRRGKNRQRAEAMKEVCDKINIDMDIGENFVRMVIDRKKKEYYHIEANLKLPEQEFNRVIHRMCVDENKRINNVFPEEQATSSLVATLSVPLTSPSSAAVPAFQIQPGHQNASEGHLNDRGRDEKEKEYPRLPEPHKHVECALKREIDTSDQKPTISAIEEAALQAKALERKTRTALALKEAQERMGQFANTFSHEKPVSEPEKRQPSEAKANPKSSATGFRSFVKNLLRKSTEPIPNQ